MKKIIVNDDGVGMRFDQYLIASFNNSSRSRLQHLIKTGEILVNEKISKPAKILSDGDIIEFDPTIFSADRNLPIGQKGEFEVIFTNNDFIVINKPSNLIVHPTGAKKTNTLVNFLLERFPEIKNAVYDESKEVSLLRPGIVHRLDKDTSGLMLIAKNKNSLRALSRMIQNHRVNKEYSVLVHGWPNASGRIESLIKRSDKHRQTMMVNSDKGRTAETAYEVIKYFHYQNQRLALIKARPVTGRTHQIRVHFKHLGFPVIGDKLYFTKESADLSKKINAKRQLLHADRLVFRFKSHDFDFSSELAKDFQDVTKKLKETDE